MNQNDILLIAAVAAAVYLLARNNSSNTIKNLGAAINGVSEIFTGAKQGEPGYGWRYFSDGTSMSPDGKYYLNGNYVWG